MDRPSVFLRTSLRICLIVASVLASVMSLTSDYNRHPDEIHHFEAAQYYINAFLPPEIGDPAVRESYSVWGVSYLNYHWIEYFLAGKFMLLVSPLGVSELIAARFFNVVLFAGLAAFFIYRSREDDDILILAAALVVTPQIWYVFSYVNNDAFALAVSFVCALLVVDPKGTLHRFLISSKISDALPGGIGFGVLLGLLLISKTNYYAFLIFLALWMLYRYPIVRIASGRLGLDLGRCRKYLVIVLTAISVLSFRIALDFHVNGETNFVGVSYLNYLTGDFEKKENRLLRYQEDIAKPQFKPSTIERDLANTHPGMRLKDKGSSYFDVFTVWRWHEMSFKSFVGVFGYMNIFAPGGYYKAIALIYAAFGAYLFVIIVIRRRRDELVVAGILLIGAAITMFISSYLSWSYAVQAQGRYLFPVLPMIAMFLYAVRSSVSRTILTGFVLTCFMLSVYSFIFVGLGKINSLPVPGTPVETSETAPRSVVRREQL
ncbi:MAG: hypothetical protein H0U23_11000 [Blastocatellia bacterium]|nr:hypothetical protein [Blastocatellia bacterium]